MSEYQVKTTALELIVPYRRKILRPTESDFTRCRYTGDSSSQSIHLATTLNNEIVGIASLIPDPREFDSFGNCQWRIRGVGVMEKHRSGGIATNMISELILKINARDDSSSWLSSRTHQGGFYEAFGFVAASAEYEIPGTGPHIDYVRV